MDKPKLLYHATNKNDLGIIKPFSMSAPKEFSHGPVVFATQTVQMATKFLVPWTDSWVNGSRFGDTHYLIVSDEKRFKESDKGGTVYALPPDTFEKLNENEWFSKKQVKPVDKKYFPSALKAMEKHNVKVLFVDEKTFQSIKQAKDHGEKIIKSLL